MRLIFGDVETSGLGDDAGVVEVAWLETDTNLVEKSRAYSLINPGVPISPSASGIHGITDADVAASPSMEAFVGDKLNDGDSILAAHNVRFDIRFFQPFMANLAGTFCSLKMARLIYPDSPDHKLQTLRYYLGLDAGDAHSADGDVRVLYALVMRMMADTKMDFMQLWEMSKQPVLIESMPFGKHKGTRLESLPLGYLKWLLNLEDLDENLRYSLELLRKAG